MTAYAQAVHDLTEGRESVATRKVRFTARVAMLRGANPKDCKRRLIRNGVPKSLASRIVAEEFAKAEPDLERSDRLIGSYLRGRLYPLVGLTSSLQATSGVVFWGMLIGLLTGLFLAITGN
jgi:hypothetical protein